MNFCGCSCRVGNDHQGIDLQVRELAVDIHGVKASDEVYKDIVNTFGNLLEKCGCYLVIRWVFGEIDGDEQLCSFCVDVANIYATFICEQYPIAL